jgi:sulfur-oxidizing protein SoxY
MPVSRRDFIAAAAGATFAAALPGHADEPAQAESVQATIDAFARGVVPIASGIALDVAAAVENGAYVSVAVAVESAMSGQDLAETIMLVAPDNPRPVVAEFHFSAHSGKARIATRIRLARSQDVIALARMRDGAVRIARQAVTVAIGGCDT